MDERRELIVAAVRQKIRIDAYITQQLKWLSRSRIKNLIKEDKVLVNGSPIKPSYIVQSDDRIILLIPPVKKLEAKPQDIPINIIFQDEYLLLINKAAGMVVHPAFGNYENTLVNALLYHIKDLSGINGVLRPGIVHRLDKDTSGILIISKDDNTHRELSKQFASRTMEKEYLALVLGTPKEKAGTIDRPLARSRSNRKKMAPSEDGKNAVTNHEVLERFPLLSYVKVKPVTGRTHQIRAHFASIGCPVFSDDLYGGRKKNLKKFNKRELEWFDSLLKILPRQALHAASITFTHPVLKKKIRFEAGLPGDFKNAIEFLKNIKTTEAAELYSEDSKNN